MHLSLQLGVQLILLENIGVLLFKELLLGLDLELLLGDVLIGFLGLGQEFLELGAQLLKQTLILHYHKVLLYFYDLVGISRGLSSRKRRLLLLLGLGEFRMWLLVNYLGGLLVVKFKRLQQIVFVGATCYL